MWFLGHVSFQFGTAREATGSLRMTSSNPFMCKTPLEYQDLVQDHMDKVVHLTQLGTSCSSSVFRMVEIGVCFAASFSIVF